MCGCTETIGCLVLREVSTWVVLLPWAIAAGSSPEGGVKHSSVEAGEELSECEGLGGEDFGEGYD
jgi:hypothetical protein